MADANFTAPNTKEVSQRLHQLTLDLIAIHELSIELSETPKKGYLQTAVQRMTEMCAKELEHCSNLLGYGQDYATTHFDQDWV